MAASYDGAVDYPLVDASFKFTIARAYGVHKPACCVHQMRVSGGIL